MRIDVVSVIVAVGITVSTAALKGAPPLTFGNQPPQCVASSPELVHCTGGLVVVELDGTGSFDPDNDPLSFQWTTGCPSAVIADPQAALTTMTIDTSLSCGSVCWVRLRVSDGSAASFCRTSVEFAELQLHFDIKPGSCPNPLNVNGGGGGEDGAAFSVLPTSLIGSKSFDPSGIEQGSLELRRVDNLTDGAGVAPISFQIADVGTPFDGVPCDCHALGGDGIPDLVMRFDKQEVIDVLGLADEEHMSFVKLRISGVLVGGQLAFGEDCVRIQNP